MSKDKNDITKETFFFCKHNKEDYFSDDGIYDLLVYYDKSGNIDMKETCYSWCDGGGCSVDREKCSVKYYKLTEVKKEEK